MNFLEVVCWFYAGCDGFVMVVLLVVLSFCDDFKFQDGFVLVRGVSQGLLS